LDFNFLNIFHSHSLSLLSLPAHQIAWIYGEAAQACFWVSEDGPPHDKPPYRRQEATLNHFAQISSEDGFYAASKQLIKTGERRIVVRGE
jgi:hypothetical protein